MASQATVRAFSDGQELLPLQFVLTISMYAAIHLASQLVQDLPLQLVAVLQDLLCKFLRSLLKPLSDFISMPGTIKTSQVLGVLLSAFIHIPHQICMPLTNFQLDI